MKLTIAEKLLLQEAIEEKLQATKNDLKYWNKDEKMYKLLERDIANLKTIYKKL